MVADRFVSFRAVRFAEPEGVFVARKSGEVDAGSTRGALSPSPSPRGLEGRREAERAALLERDRPTGDGLAQLSA